MTTSKFLNEFLKTPVVIDVYRPLAGRGKKGFTPATALVCL